MLQPAFSGQREIRITDTTTKRKNMSCLAPVKFMGINRMMLLNRWRVYRVGLTCPQIFDILMYFLTPQITAALLHT